MISKNVIAAAWPLIAAPIVIGLSSGLIDDDKSPFILSIIGTALSLFFFAKAITKEYKLRGIRCLYLWIGVLIMAVPVGAAQWWISFELMIKIIK